MDRVIKREQHLVNLASGGTDEQASWRVRALVGEEVLEGQYLGAESLCDVRETPNNSGVAGVMATTA